MEARPIRVTSAEKAKSLKMLQYVSDPDLCVRSLTLHFSPQDFSQHTRTMNVDGRDVAVTIWDLQGDKEIERVRCLVYPQLAAVLVLFAVCYSRSPFGQPTNRNLSVAAAVF